MKGIAVESGKECENFKNRNPLAAETKKVRNVAGRTFKIFSIIFVVAFLMSFTPIVAVYLKLAISAAVLKIIFTASLGTAGVSFVASLLAWRNFSVKPKEEVKKPDSEEKQVVKEKAKSQEKKIEKPNVKNIGKESVVENKELSEDPDLQKKFVTTVFGRETVVEHVEKPDLPGSEVKDFVVIPEEETVEEVLPEKVEEDELENIKESLNNPKN